MIEKLMKEGDIPDKDTRYLRAMDDILKAESDLEKCLQNQQPLHALTDASTGGSGYAACLSFRVLCSRRSNAGCTGKSQIDRKRSGIILRAYFILGGIMMKETFVCSSCGAEFPIDDCTLFDGQELCPDCLDEETTVCDHCGDRIWRDNAEGNDSITLCHSCYENDYVTCAECGTLLLNGDAYYLEDDEDTPYCYQCYTEHLRHQYIHNYYYKPEPVFYGEGPRYFGIELEIDEGGESSTNAEKLLAIANAGKEYLYAKHDGSLDDGFELVSEPCSISVHQEEVPWLPVLQNAVSLSYTSHKAGTCKLHLHVSRAAFRDSEEQQDVAIARILYFVEKHWEELLKFSRRTEAQLKRWAARYVYKEQPQEILDHAKKGYGGGRYTCVNLTNTDTIEFRMFRGTLKYNTFIATLQLVNQICDVALSCSDEEVKALSWTSFVSSIEEARYPELITYLKERRLYTNEPVLAAEEV